jgi:hypothetical protein
MTNFLQDTFVLKRVFGLFFGNYDLCVLTEFGLVTVLVINREVFDNNKM